MRDCGAIIPSLIIDPLRILKAHAAACVDRRMHSSFIDYRSVEDTESRYRADRHRVAKAPSLIIDPLRILKACVRVHRRAHLLLNLH